MYTAREYRTLRPFPLSLTVIIAWVCNGGFFTKALVRKNCEEVFPFLHNTHRTVVSLWNKIQDISKKAATLHDMDMKLPAAAGAGADADDGDAAASAAALEHDISAEEKAATRLSKAIDAGGTGSHGTQVDDVPAEFGEVPISEYDNCWLKYFYAKEEAFIEDEASEAGLTVGDGDCDGSSDGDGVDEVEGKAEDEGEEGDGNDGEDGGDGDGDGNSAVAGGGGGAGTKPAASATKVKKPAKKGDKSGVKSAYAMATGAVPKPAAAGEPFVRTNGPPHKQAGHDEHTAAARAGGAARRVDMLARMTEVQHMQAAHAPFKEAADRVIARLSALEARLEFCEKQFSASSDKYSSMVGNPSVSAAALAQFQHVMDMWQKKMDKAEDDVTRMVALSEPTLVAAVNMGAGGARGSGPPPSAAAAVAATGRSSSTAGSAMGSASSAVA